MKHLKYLRYVVRHKWFVFIECLKYGLVWQGIVHDWSKFLPSEWMSYAMYFYGKPSWRYGWFGWLKNANEIERDFDAAWLRHQHRNPHHWQHWVLREDSGAVKVLQMPRRFAKEMLADWRGAGRSGRIGCRSWYEQNKSKIVLHPDTQAFVESELAKEPRP